LQPGKPSETAARIAVRRVSAACDPFLRKLLAHPDEPYSAWFAEEHSPRARAELNEWRAAESGAGHRRLADVLDPGGALSLLVRKRFVEDEVRSALADGARQMVVLGAGYDPLPLLLAPEFPGVRFWELDHPATQDVKRRALANHSALPDRVELLPVDFASEPLDAALRRASGFRAGERTVFVAEGVLMYLPPRALDALLRAVVGAGGRGSRFVFSLIDRRAALDVRHGIGRTAAYATRFGEPIRSAHDRRTLPRMLARRGLRCRRICDADDLWSLYLEPLGALLRPRPGELLVSAEMGGRRS
jgi:methyltransferase (TIGR00027 family)